MEAIQDIQDIPGIYCAESLTDEDGVLHTPAKRDSSQFPQKSFDMMGLLTPMHLVFQSNQSNFEKNQAREKLIHETMLEIQAEDLTIETRLDQTLPCKRTKNK